MEKVDSTNQYGIRDNMCHFSRPEVMSGKRLDQQSKELALFPVWRACMQVTAVTRLFGRWRHGAHIGCFGNFLGTVRGATIWTTVDTRLLHFSERSKMAT
jgi:hypothetical protein